MNIEPTSQSELQTDEGLLRTVWGHVHAGEEARGVYYVRWNETLLDEALFIVSLGEWGEGSTSAERACVAALGRVHEGSLAFMLIDAGETSFGETEFLGAMQRAADVRGTPLATEAFHVFDHVLADDPRVTDLRQRLEDRARTAGRTH